jgi:hypothetical protein
MPVTDTGNNPNAIAKRNSTFANTDTNADPNSIANTDADTDPNSNTDADPDTDSNPALTSG